MNNAEMKVVRFDERDVIATSGSSVKSITIAKSLNNVLNDNTYTFGNGIQYMSSTLDEAKVTEYFGAGAFTKLMLDPGYSLEQLIQKDTGNYTAQQSGLDISSSGNSGSKANWYNTTFYWINNAWSKENQ